LGIDGKRRNVSSSGYGGLASLLPAVREGRPESMAQRSETGSGKPGYGHAPRARITELDPLRELPYGPAAHNGRIRGRTHVSTRPRSLLIRKILLASLGASTHVHKECSQYRASFGKAALGGRIHAFC
jgi:hypothetical protein